MNSLPKNRFLFLLPVTIMLSCGGNSLKPSKELITQLDLKSGQLIFCGPPDKEFGIVDFDMTCSEKVKNDFNIADILNFINEPPVNTCYLGNSIDTNSKHQCILDPEYPVPFWYFDVIQ